MRILICCVAVIIAAVSAEIVEYHSLTPPFISDWWQGGVPHWDFGGSTVVTDKYIRLAPDKQSRTGWLWNDQANHLESWEGTLTFRIHAKRNPGADGMALWYVEQPWKFDPTNEHHNQQTKIWGNRADFVGVGIIFDTYDNDGQRDNPGVLVIKGKGDPHHKWNTDDDLTSQAELKCSFEYRNTGRDEKVTARLVYAHRRLTIWMAIQGGTETQCGSVNNLDLMPGYFFGLTAATGHLADNHDVHGFVVTAAPEMVAHEDEIVYGQGEGDPTQQQHGKPRRH